MDIGLREWLIIGGGLVILLIILDGWRRVKGSRRALKMDIDQGIIDLPETDESNPELPNGGARVRDGKQPAAQPGAAAAHIEPSFTTSIELSDEIADVQQPSAQKTQLNASPEDIALKQQLAADIEQIPLITDYPDALNATPSAEAEFDVSPMERTLVADSAEQVSVTEETIPNEQIFANVLAASDRHEAPVIAEQENLTKSDNAAATVVSVKPKAADPLFAPVPEDSIRQPEEEPLEPIRLDDKPVSANADPLLDDVAQWPPAGDGTAQRNDMPMAKNSATIHPLSAAVADNQVALQEVAELAEAVVEAPVKAKPADVVQPVATAADPEIEPVAEPAISLLDHARVDLGPTKAPDPDNSLVLMVASNQAEGFSGQALLQVILACGLRFGHMDIFHRFEDGIDCGAVQFSMANATQNGCFDLEQMSDQRIRAVTFFMSMNEPREVMNAFDCMLATAETLARNLNGDLLDENRNMVRAQTQEHYRQRVRDFEMHSLRRRSG